LKNNEYDEKNSSCPFLVGGTIFIRACPKNDVENEYSVLVDGIAQSWGRVCGGR
jgi:hypothetical protein